MTKTSSIFALSKVMKLLTNNDGRSSLSCCDEAEARTYQIKNATISEGGKSITLTVYMGNSNQKFTLPLSSALIKKINLTVSELPTDDHFECSDISPRSLCGKYLTESDFLYISKKSEAWAATKSALDILSYSSNSAKMLTLKLLRKGYSQSAVNTAVKYVSDKGMINPERDALSEANKCIKKFWGRKKIEIYLLQRGYSTQHGSVRELLDSTDFGKLCALYVRKYHKNSPAVLQSSGAEDGSSVLSRKKEKEKLSASLARRGFSLNDISMALNRESFDWD